MNSLTLRKASKSDSKFVFLAKRVAFREYVEKVWGWDEAEQLRLHEQRFAAQDFRIVNLAGTDVGIVALVVEPDDLTLNQLFILPEQQGRGIGRQCMMLILEEARELRLPVRLQVLKVNPRALAFYQRLGFTHTGETDTHILLEKTLVDQPTITEPNAIYKNKQGGSKMRLELENGTTIESPASSQIAAALAFLEEDDANSFAILSRDDDTYMQTATASQNGFILEYQAGSIENHYQSVENHLPLERVIQVFQAYASGDDSWRESFTWMKVDF